MSDNEYHSSDDEDYVPDEKEGDVEDEPAVAPAPIACRWILLLFQILQGMPVPMVYVTF